MLDLTKTQNLESINDRGKYVETKRKDGLTVFFDKGDDAITKALNEIRLNGDRKAVFRAFTIMRGLQLARSYIQKHGTEQDLAEHDQDIDHFLDNTVPDLLGKPRIGQIGEMRE